jgi:hypothetical protein
MASLPGATLFHEGQFEGRRIRIPVFLARRPEEPVDEPLRSFYHQLLDLVSNWGLREGEWRMGEPSGWPDNSSFHNLLTWCWRGAAEPYLIVVNFSDTGAQGRVLLPWDDLGGRSWRLQELFTGTVYERDGAEMRDSGLYVELGPWGYHLFRFYNE